MMHSRSLLLLAGLPAALTFGTIDRVGTGIEVTVTTEAVSAQVKADTSELPDDVCNRLTDSLVTVIDSINNPNEWCNTEKPSQSRCTDANRLRLSKQTITTLGPAVIYDVCAWDVAKNKCILAEVSYICQSTCPGVPVIGGIGSPPVSDYATDVYIQTECSLKTELSAGQWYEDPPGSDDYYQYYVTDITEPTCKQKLVRCLAGEIWMPAETLKGSAGECQAGVDACCWSPTARLNPVVTGRRMEEEPPKPARRRLADVCEAETTQTTLTNDKGEKSICCVTTTADGMRLNPSAEWLEQNPESRGYYKGNPQTDPEQYNLVQKCEVVDNACVCTTEEIQVSGTAPVCPPREPVPWGAASGRRA